jgi:prepilin-type N-terminal cleavage/methylation domain-containing protein
MRRFFGGKRKLKSRKGFTLVETLAAVAVLAMLSLMLNTGLNMALRSYRDMRAESETQLLLSTLTSVLSDELRYARDVRSQPDGALQDYTSATYGSNTSLQVTQGRLTNGNGEPLLTAGAYGNGDYAITDMEITYENGVFTAALTVADSQGVSARAEGLKIRCLNESFRSE